MGKKKGKKEGKKGQKEIELEGFGMEEEVPATYRSLVTGRLLAREGVIMTKLSEMQERELRFTVRIFADCMEEEDMERFLDGYSEYMIEEDLMKFVGDFVPKYTAYAIAELEQRKEKSEGFEPEQITGEELQEMAIKEKWPKLGKKPEAFSSLRLRREIAKLALCLRPYMLSDPGWNESLLEFSLYYDIQEKLKELPVEEIHDVVRKMASMVLQADKVKGIKEKEEELSKVRAYVLSLAGMEGDVKELIGPLMERYPREAPEGWELAEFRHNLRQMSKKDLQMSAFVYIELLTLSEMEELTRPFMDKYSSFHEMDKETLIDLICALVYGIGDRQILDFFERYTKGKMMVVKAYSPETWKLIPREKKLQHLREDNDEMDIALMARHLARLYMTEMYSKLYDYDFQVDLIKNPGYMKTQGALVSGMGEAGEGKLLRALNDEVTVSMIDVVSSREDIREKYAALRKRIASALGFEI
ncbi:MAG: hypothetical protein GTN70_00365 [Deltaproteobacteria bacterium]|nr:hypothetical protein [Deltaproteobacteria bacterium]NIS76113.1 hypothetical protein [Deltaproteobacteria bacterium]